MPEQNQLQAIISGEFAILIQRDGAQPERRRGVSSLDIIQAFDEARMLAHIEMHSLIEDGWKNTVIEDTEFGYTISVDGAFCAMFNVEEVGRSE